METPSTWTIGKRITFGFAVVLIAMGLASGYATWTMKHAELSAQTIANQTLPEAVIGSKLVAQIGDIRVAARDFALTYAPAYSEKAKKLFEGVRATLSDAKALSVAHPAMAKLSDDIQRTEPLVVEYEKLIFAMEVRGAAYIKARDAAGQTALDLNNSWAKIVTLQSKLFKQDTTASGSVSAQPSAEQFKILELAVEGQLHTNLACVGNWKSQVVHKVELLETSHAELAKVRKNLEELAPLVTATEIKAELSLAKQLVAAYEGTIDDVRTSTLTFDEITFKHTAQGAKLATSVADLLANVNMRVQEAASSSGASLTRSMFTVIGAVMGGIAIGIVAAYFIIRGTNKVLMDVTHTLEDGTNQIVSSAGQVSFSSQELSQASSRHASSLE